MFASGSNPMTSRESESENMIAGNNDDVIKTMLEFFSTKKNICNKAIKLPEKVRFLLVH